MTGAIAPAGAGADPLARLRSPSGAAVPDATVPGATVPGATVPGGLGALDGNAFLTLLVEQMRAQDPTDPQSATDHLAQLATFAEVEQSVAIRESIDRAGLASSLEAAGALIGRTVTGPDGAGGTVATVQLHADGATATLEDGTRLRLGPGVRVGP